MTTQPPLPEDPSEVTPEWLTGALRERFPDVSVSSVEILEIHHGTNSNARVRVGCEGAGALPETCFLKLPPLDPARREQIHRTGMGRREARFYRHLADRVPMRVPTPYVAQLDEATGAFVLLIEDLTASGCAFPDPFDGVTYGQASMAMRDYALLHVPYEDESYRRRQAGWVERMPRGTDFGPSMLQYGLDHHRDRLADGFAEMAELYIAQQAELEALWDRGSQTLLQGDSHIGNLFLDSGRPGFLDWGLIQLGTPMRDVGYFITMALTPENRRRHERELIQEYLEARVEAGGVPIEFEDAWLLHRVHAAYAVPAACPLVLFPERVEPDHARLSAAFLERSQRVVEDLDVREALREFAGI
ncbi:MAG: hypothetical protein CL908_12170 [Deltaproteobacteria bacterium]|nr:hypothetical protein [Deltaproteobacteria bacterium]